LAGFQAAQAAPGNFTSLTTQGPNRLGGDTTVRHLFASEIDPNTVANQNATATNIGDNVAVIPGNLVLTNEIDPLSTNTTTMSGNFQVNGNLQLDSGVTVVDSTVFTNEIDPTSGDITHFSGNVTITSGKKLLVNE